MHHSPTSLRSPRVQLGVLLAGAWLVLLSLWAVAQDDTLTPAETRGAQQAVQAQLDALAAGDAHRAFALADAELRSRFASAQDFLAMVRSHYPMVHHPASVSFLAPHAENGLVVQRVRVADGQGRHWLLTYLLQQQRSERQWRISACLVVPDSPPLMV
jgi:hypothetical protein